VPRVSESAAVALGHAAARGSWLAKPEGVIPTFANIDDAAARHVSAAPGEAAGG
jgi:hypothetical protein